MFFLTTPNACYYPTHQSHLAWLHNIWRKQWNILIYFILLSILLSYYPVSDIFPHYLIKGTIFRKVCVLILSTNFCEILYCHKCENVLHVKYPLYVSEINAISMFSTDFSNNTQMSNFIKIRPVGAVLFQADGCTETDKKKKRRIYRRHDEANSRFLQFCERAYKWQNMLILCAYRVEILTELNRSCRRIYVLFDCTSFIKDKLIYQFLSYWQMMFQLNTFYVLKWRGEIDTIRVP